MNTDYVDPAQLLLAVACLLGELAKKVQTDDGLLLEDLCDKIFNPDPLFVPESELH